MHDGQIYFGKCKREINFSLFAQSRASKISDCRREIKELTEGMCNVTYHIVFDDDIIPGPDTIKVLINTIDKYTINTSA